MIGITRRTAMGCMLPFAAQAASNDAVMRSVRSMEQSEGLTIISGIDAIFHRWHGARLHAGWTVWPAVAPDAQAIAWGEESSSRTGPFLTVSSADRGVQEIDFDGHWAGAIAISANPRVAVVTAIPNHNAREGTLVIVDLDTSRVRQRPSGLPDRAPQGLSASGNLVAFSAYGRVTVADVATGGQVYDGPGEWPRLSPDGTRLAFVNEEKLVIADLGTRRAQSFAIRKVKGLGGWSPDGRFLLAGAWTRRLAWDKRLIGVDTSSGRYAEIGKIGEGDYGTNLRWVRASLLDRSIGPQRPSH